MSDTTFGDLATAAYCPRQLYYRRRDAEWEPPPDNAAVRQIAFQYGRLIHASDETLAAAPVAVEPPTWRENLARAAEAIDAWDELCRPPDRQRSLEGRDCRGVAHKVLGDPPGVSVVSAGTPPARGAWKSHRVRAVATAKALAWERREGVERAYVEYPAHGVVRRIPIDGRRRAEYRRVLRSVRTMDGPPPRLRNTAKCSACSYRETCGVRTRTLRSLLG